MSTGALPVRCYKRSLLPMYRCMSLRVCHTLGHAGSTAFTEENLRATGGADTRGTRTGTRGHNRHRPPTKTLCESGHEQAWQTESRAAAKQTGSRGKQAPARHQIHGRGWAASGHLNTSSALFRYCHSQDLAVEGTRWARGRSGTATGSQRISYPVRRL